MTSLRLACGLLLLVLAAACYPAPVGPAVDGDPADGPDGDPVIDGDDDGFEREAEAETGDTPGDADQEPEGERENDQEEEAPPVGTIIRIPVDPFYTEFEIPFPSGDEEYLLALYSFSQQAGARYPAAIGAEPAAPPATAAGRFLQAPLTRHRTARFDLVARSLRPASRSTVRGLPSVPADVRQGDRVTVWTQSARGGREQAVQIEAEAVRVTGSVIVLADRTYGEPQDELSAAELDALASGFADLILPRNRFFFGHESDVDGDGRVALLFSPLVADLATAYFNPYDLIVDESQLPPGSGSNHMEILHLSPPGRTGAGPDEAVPMLLEVVAHEFCHAIYYHRKFLQHGNLYDIENVYITEGFAHLAMDLSGLQRYNLHYVFWGLRNLAGFSFADIFGASFGGYDSERDGVLRAGAYLALRQLYDRAGGEAPLPDGTFEDRGGPGLIRRLVESPLLGIGNLQAELSENVRQTMDSLFLALLLDDRTDPAGRPLSSDPLHRFADPYPDPVTGNQRGVTMVTEVVPGWTVEGPELIDFGEHDGRLRAGGVRYFRVEAPAGGGNLSVHFSTAASHEVGLTLIRSE